MGPISPDVLDGCLAICRVIVCSVWFSFHVCSFAVGAFVFVGDVAVPGDEASRLSLNSAARSLRLEIICAAGLGKCSYDIKKTI